MSETKHTPLPWMKQPAVNQSTFKDYVELYRPPGYPNEPIGTLSPYLHDAEANADLILTSVNARPKVEELLAAVNKLKGHLEDSGEYRICRADKEQMGLPDQMTIGQVLCDIEDKAREVESALGGKAE